MVQSIVAWPRAAEDMLIARFSMRSFLAVWKTCDITANLLAHVLSRRYHEPDVEEYVLSTVINELLEAVHRRHARLPDEALQTLAFSVGVQRVGEAGTGALETAAGVSSETAVGDRLRVALVLALPDAGGQRPFFEEIVQALSRESAQTIYWRILERGEEFDGAGLLEIATNYGVALEMQAPCDAHPYEYRVIAELA